MAKTQGGGKTGSIDTMIELLRFNNNETRKQTSAIRQFIDAANRNEMVSGKEALETAAESKAAPAAAGRFRIGGMMSAAGKGVLGAATSPFRGMAKMLGLLLTPLSMAVGPLMTTLKPLVKLLKVGGPIGLLFGAMYAMFRDIGENEKFSATITTIKDTFNNNILPTFNAIKENVNALLGMEAVGTTFTSIGDWFTNFKTQIQDFVLENLANITETISGVLTGINELLIGDWKAGISTIGTSLFNGIKNFFDSAITNILEMFGADFGESGSFLGSIGGMIDTALVKMIGVWNGFTTGLKDKWEGLVNFFIGDDGYIKSTITSLKIGITTRWNAFTGSITDTWNAITDTLTVDIPAKISDLKDGMIDAWNNVSGSIMGALGRVKLWFETKPLELGMMLEKNFIETKGAFMEKLASFAGMITTIPSRLKLALLESLKGTMLGDYFVSDQMITNARQAVASGQEFSDRMIANAASNTEAQLAELAARRSALDASIAERQAALNVIAPSVNNSTQSQTSISLNAGNNEIADPYASSYMGRLIPGAF
jgi:hypothetical protein|tara:strand:- start:337 stop:1962 length:1626 start_codon:yes stop_codon:yes gene_type:complete